MERLSRTTPSAPRSATRGTPAYDARYYRAHTDHYRGTDLARIPSFAWLKSRLPGTRTGTILDAGCGTGYLLDFLTPPGWEGYGIDVSPQAVSVAATHYRRLRCRTGSVTRLPYRTGMFDAVVCFNVIEHIPDQRGALTELVRVLKPGGILLMGTNIRDSLSWRLFSLFLGGDPTHVHEFTADGLVSFVGSAIPVTHHTRSSCIARFHPSLNAVFHRILKGDILVAARKPIPPAHP